MKHSMHIPSGNTEASQQEKCVSSPTFSQLLFKIFMYYPIELEERRNASAYTVFIILEILRRKQNNFF